jgi:hypothetical protein
MTYTAQNNKHGTSIKNTAEDILIAIILDDVNLELAHSLG